jgi:hypothetical protein
MQKWLKGADTIINKELFSFSDLCHQIPTLPTNG